MNEMMRGDRGMVGRCRAAQRDWVGDGWLGWLLVIALAPFPAGIAWADGAALIDGLGGPAGVGEDALGEQRERAVDLGAVFPDGLHIGGHDFGELYVNRPGMLSFGRGLPYSPAPFPRAYGIPVFAPFHAPMAIGRAPDGTANEVYIHQVPPRPGRRGEMIVTWLEMGYFQNWYDALNTFQIRIVDSMGGNAHIELRYTRCEWFDARVEGRPASLAFDYGDGRGWMWTGSGGPEMLDLCVLGNTGTPGLWRYRLAAGEVRGCGDGIVEGLEACDDGNHLLADGCSVDCRVEVDRDGDGHFERPEGLELTDIHGAYDTCVPEWAGGPGCAADRDDDGVADIEDNCRDEVNPRQEDLDGDGVGDVCDSDDDEDGVQDREDNCPRVFNPPADGMPQADADDDGLGDACDGDRDGDGVLDADDRCPETADPGNTDLDGDGVGDACDPDPDGDGVDEGDNCPEVPNPRQADLDADGLGNPCDPDADGDGIDDEADPCVAVYGDAVTCGHAIEPSRRFDPGRIVVVEPASEDESPAQPDSSSDLIILTGPTNATCAAQPADTPGGAWPLVLLALAGRARRFRCVHELVKPCPNERKL